VGQRSGLPRGRETAGRAGTDLQASVQLSCNRRLCDDARPATFETHSDQRALVEFQPVTVSTTADAGNARVIDADPIPPARLSLQDMAYHGTNHPGVAHHQDTLSRLRCHHVLIGRPHPCKKVLQRLGAYRAVTDRLAMPNEIHNGLGVRRCFATHPLFRNPRLSRL